MGAAKNKVTAKVNIVRSAREETIDKDELESLLKKGGHRRILDRLKNMGLGMRHNCVRLKYTSSTFSPGMKRVFNSLNRGFLIKWGFEVVVYK